MKSFLFIGLVFLAACGIDRRPTAAQQRDGGDVGAAGGGSSDVSLLGPKGAHDVLPDAGALDGSAADAQGTLDADAGALDVDASVAAAGHGGAGGAGGSGGAGSADAGPLNVCGGTGAIVCGDGADPRYCSYHLGQLCAGVDGSYVKCGTPCNIVVPGASTKYECSPTDHNSIVCPACKCP